MKSGSNLERVLESGTFAVTAEIAPPKSTSTEGLRKKVRALRDAQRLSTSLITRQPLCDCRQWPHPSRACRREPNR